MTIVAAIVRYIDMVS